MKLLMKWVGCAVCVVMMGGVGSAQRSESELVRFVQSHYTKQEYRIPMRDGVKLYTQVYTPIARKMEDKGPYPFLMTKTPYSCGNYDNDTIAPHTTENEALLRSGYILVCQDVRGRWASEGTWEEMTPSHDGKGIDESTDMYDTVEWMLKHVPDNDGRVGLLGISYGGFYTASSIIDSHPAIKAASPQAPIIDLWMGDDSYHGGALMLQANHTFYMGFKPQQNPIKVEPKRGFDYGSKGMYAYYMKMGTLEKLDSPESGTNPYFHDLVVHSTYDAYWKERNLAPHMHGVKAAVLDVGGLFDAEDIVGPVKVFHAIDRLSPEATENTLIEGPWFHGQWARDLGEHLGDVHFGSDTAVFYRNEIEAPFFEHWLKEKAWNALPKAYVFETGSDVWKKYAAWPPPVAKKKMLYLEPGGGLGWNAPTAAASKDEYVSDPANPVPYVAESKGTGVPREYMDGDQRFVAKRADVLVFQTEPLTEDVTIAGPVTPTLKIASTGTDSDFVVKLIDVYPANYDGPEGKLAGYEMMVRGEPMRAKFRKSWE
ncbi:MAG: CocE/NonD family hydrolase, partial [Bryocella sp.]